VIDDIRLLKKFSRSLKLKIKESFRNGARPGPERMAHAPCSGTARSVEDETRNDRRNANRNPEWWGDFIQLQN